MLNRKCTICSTSKPFWEIRSTYEPVFHRYLPIGHAYSMHRCLEREIWRFSCRQRRQRQRQTDKPIALPLAHACGVKINNSIACMCRHACTVVNRIQHMIQFSAINKKFTNSHNVKIAISRVLGICTCYKHNQSVDIGEKIVCTRFEFLKKAYYY